MLSPDHRPAVLGRARTCCTTCAEEVIKPASLNSTKLDQEIRKWCSQFNYAPKQTRRLLHGAS